MKEGRLIYSLHIHVDLFTVRYYPTRPCCKDLRQVAKFYHVNPKFQTYATWNWHTESATNIIQLIAFCDSAVVYAACLIC